jgi:septum site-determining protein MinC
MRGGMNNSVIIKSNKQGITVILDNEISFDELKSLVKEKFTQSSSFFGNADMALAFEGRDLSNEEQQQLLDVIDESTNMRIICVLDNKSSIGGREDAIASDSLLVNGNADGLFYKGTLRSGQVLESETSVIILGDVNPGGRVVAKGNVIVLGSLRGNAYAGASGNENCFVVALDMNPMQIKIADVIARSSDTSVAVKIKRARSSRLAKQTRSVEPKIAFVEDGNIYVEDLTSSVIDDIKIN